MKRGKPFLSTASVFFIVLILLVSCGIATRFYIDSRIEKLNSSIKDTVLGKYSVISDPLNNLSWIDVGSGPSLMLFYLITDDPNPPSGIISTFNSTYQRNYAGMSISSDEILTVNDYTLYRFSDDQGTDFKSPYYIASAVDPLDPDFTCTITKNISNGTLADMNLTFDTGAYTIHNQSFSYGPPPTAALRRFGNYGQFETDIFKVRGTPGNYPEYQEISSTASSMFIHIYAAVNISPKGSFNNIYWTDLVNLGCITL
jgi:hypothetical protein